MPNAINAIVMRDSFGTRGWNPAFERPGSRLEKTSRGALERAREHEKRGAARLNAALCEAVQHPSDHSITAGEVEFEHRLCARFGAREQEGSQTLARAEEARLHRLDGDIETLGDIDGGHLLDGAQHEHGPELDRELGDRVFQELAQLPIEAAFFRCARGARHGRLLVRRVERRDALLSADAADGLVDGDAGEPSREARALLEALEVLEGAHVRVLHHVLRLVVGAYDRTHRPEYP